MEEQIQQILTENQRRNAEINTTFNPITGEGSLGERQQVCITDTGDPHTLFLPTTMMTDGWMARAADLHSLRATDPRASESDLRLRYTLLRCRHDFAYWAARFVKIKPKQGGDDMPFVLNRPQRRLINALEEQRLAGQPLRLILLKARQWGGSTATQIYMAWWQLILCRGLNSLIVGHVKTASAEVCGMFEKMMEAYPEYLLNEEGRAPKGRQAKIVGDRHSRLLRYIPARGCKIKVGSAETPNSARGGDSALVHCTEVAFWKHTQGKSPEDIVRSACAGAGYLPHTCIVYESTANGTGNFFQREYDAARQGVSQFRSLFIAWWQIEQYALTLTTDQQRALATALYEHRDEQTSPAPRTLPGRYLWRLWQMGATLQAIAWYQMERRKYDQQADFAAEFPSDDVEAFKHSGANVFDAYHVDQMRRHCQPPILRGEMVGRGTKGAEALSDLRIEPSEYGPLWVWQQPDADNDCRDRYLAVVDIGGRSPQADWSVICVFDRATADGRPAVVAQWRGHIDIDLLAWRAAQIATYYQQALLVIESNTLETHSPYHLLEGGDQAPFILQQVREVYSNLYARAQSAEEIRMHAPLRYGFHTNVKTKPEIISTLIAAVRDGLYIERDDRCLDELLTYERRANGSYAAIEGKHDDLLMTRAIALHISFHHLPPPRITPRHTLHRLRRPTISGPVW